VSHSVVLEALGRFGIPQNGNGHKRIGHLPFGFDYVNHQLLMNKGEQAVIRMMRQYRAGGLSLREIAGSLNLKLIVTKKNGIWQANTVRGILARA
jgi:site-specific DNA recombinase